jgi:hypothetical protein
MRRGQPIKQARAKGHASRAAEGTPQPIFCCSWPIVLDRFFSTDPVNNVVEESIPALVPKANRHCLRIRQAVMDNDRGQQAIVLAIFLFAVSSKLLPIYESFITPPAP